MSPDSPDTPAGTDMPSSPDTPDGAPSRRAASPTSRARRTAAAGQTGLRPRPNPSPVAEPAPETAFVARRPSPGPTAETSTETPTETPTATPAEHTVGSAPNYPDAPAAEPGTVSEPEPTAESSASGSAPSGAAPSGAAPSGAAPSGAAPSGAPMRTGIVLLALAVVLVAANVVLLLLPSRKSDSQVDRDAVLSAAKSSTALVISYDYHNVAASAAKAAPFLTGAFASDYQKSITTVIEKKAPSVKAVVQGQVDTAGIEAISPDGKQVTVIVFGQQLVSNTSLSQPRTDLLRLRVTMDKVGSEWKIAKLDQIG